MGLPARIVVIWFDYKFINRACLFVNDLPLRIKMCSAVDQLRFVFIIVLNQNFWSFFIFHSKLIIILTERWFSRHFFFWNFSLVLLFYIETSHLNRELGFAFVADYSNLWKFVQKWPAFSLYCLFVGKALDDLDSSSIIGIWVQVVLLILP